jgi:hypothetical protein
MRDDRIRSSVSPSIMFVSFDETASAPAGIDQIQSYQDPEMKMLTRKRVREGMPFCRGHS